MPLLHLTCQDSAGIVATITTLSCHGTCSLSVGQQHGYTCCYFPMFCRLLVWLTRRAQRPSSSAVPSSASSMRKACGRKMNDPDVKHCTQFVSKKPLRLEIKLAWSQKYSVTSYLAAACQSVRMIPVHKNELGLAIDSSNLLLYSSNTHFLFQVSWN